MQTYLCTVLTNFCVPTTTNQKPRTPHKGIGIQERRFFHNSRSLFLNAPMVMTIATCREDNT